MLTQLGQGDRRNPVMAMLGQLLGQTLGKAIPKPQEATIRAVISAACLAAGEVLDEHLPDRFKGHGIPNWARNFWIGFVGGFSISESPSDYSAQRAAQQVWETVRKSDTHENAVAPPSSSLNPSSAPPAPKTAPKS